MGEFADMIINSLVDQHTGEVIDGHAPGYPRSQQQPKNRRRKSDGDFRCEKCGSEFKEEEAWEARGIEGNFYCSEECALAAEDSCNETMIDQLTFLPTQDDE